MSNGPIRVLLVDDSPVVLALLKKSLSSSPDIEVIGTARNGKQALELIPALRPQVICTDLHMPLMDGLALTKAVLEKFPLPILVISAHVQATDTDNVFELLEAGAIDVFPKPVSTAQGKSYEAQTEELIYKIKVLAGVKAFTKRTLRTLPVPAKVEPAAARQAPLRIAAVGASTGGPQALQAVFSQLPSDFPIPILCVQHISEGFIQGLVSWLASQCSLKVKIAQPGELPRAGHIYFPEEETHLVLDNKGCMQPSTIPPVGGHRPAVTVTFLAVAKYYRAAAAAVLLTGMGADGAIGMQAISAAGGLTIAQDEATCVVFGMPKQAIALGAAQHVLPITEIPRLLQAEVGSLVSDTG